VQYHHEIYNQFLWNMFWVGGPRKARRTANSLSGGAVCAPEGWQTKASVPPGRLTGSGFLGQDGESDGLLRVGVDWV